MRASVCARPGSIVASDLPNHAPKKAMTYSEYYYSCSIWRAVWQSTSGRPLDSGILMTIRQLVCCWVSGVIARNGDRLLPHPLPTLAEGAL